MKNSTSSTSRQKKKKGRGVGGGLVNSCRMLAMDSSSDHDNKPDKNIDSNGTNNLINSINSSSTSHNRPKKDKGDRVGGGLVNSCRILTGDVPSFDHDNDPTNKVTSDGNKNRKTTYRGLNYFLNTPSQDEVDIDNKEDEFDIDVDIDISNDVAAALQNSINSCAEDVSEKEDPQVMQEKRVVTAGGVTFASTTNFAAQDEGGAEWDPMASDDSDEEEISVKEEQKINAKNGKSKGEQKNNPRVSAIRRSLSKHYDDLDHEVHMDLPASTHTLLHTEPIFSLPFFFALGIAVLSAMCLILVLVSEFKQGEQGNLFDVPTGINRSVRVAQFCGIFVGLLMEEEIPQGLILMRSISRKSLHASYPDLSYTRFILSCLLRLFMGYLFLINLFVTIVQADDVITIFFDILALEFVQHLDDMAFELGRKDILGRTLNVATNIEYKVLTRSALKRSTISANQDEENALIEQELQQQHDSQMEGEDREEWRCYFFRRRRHKKMGFRWILKAAYFINLAALMMGTIIVGQRQQKYKYHCESVSIRFGDQVWESAFVTNWTGLFEFFQGVERKTLIYSYFNGVYRITEQEVNGRPVYEEMNKISGTPYKQTVGAKFVYCEDEEAWVFRHDYISKREHNDGEEGECQDWLLRSPKTNVYDLFDVPRDDWSVWTGVITSSNKVSIVCNECSHDSDCNYNGICNREDGECNCTPGFFGLHCEFEEACPVLIDDEGELYKRVNNSKNETLYSYMRPIYRSRSVDLGDFDDEGAKTASQDDNSSNTDNVFATEEIPAIGTVNNETLVNYGTNSCYPRAKTIKLEATTGEQIAMFELIALSAGENVGLRGTASQSSDRDNGELLTASMAIDGNNETFSHTNDPNATFEVDLDQVYPIEQVTIVNRYCGNNPSADPLGCLCRLSHSTLLLLDDAGMVVATNMIGNTCGQKLVSEFYTTDFLCPTLPINSTELHEEILTELLNNTVGNFTENEFLSALNQTFDWLFDFNETINALNETDNALNETADWLFDFDLSLYFTITLVYSGSRWFGTLDISFVENPPDLSEYTYGDEYHAFWNDLYEARTFFLSDPTNGATPVGVDFYKNQFAEAPQWDDYGPFGLLHPVHNISGKGYFHCYGTNKTAVKVSSDAGKYGEG